jgi:hypothetical protein
VRLYRLPWLEGYPTPEAVLSTLQSSQPFSAAKIYLSRGDKQTAATNVQALLASGSTESDTLRSAVKRSGEQGL